MSKLLSIGLLLLASHGVMFGMAQQIVELYGKKAMMHEHVLEASKNAKHPFHNAPFFRINSQTKKIKEYGNIGNCTEQDITEVRNGNYVYTPYFYRNVPGRGNIPGLFVGSNDNNLIQVYTVMPLSAMLSGATFLAVQKK